MMLRATDLVIAEAGTEWNGYFEAALSIPVRVGCTVLNSVGLREGVGIVTGLSWVSSTLTRFQSGGWMVPIDLLFLHSIWLTDHSAYRTHIFNKLLCLFVHFNPKMALHIPFCRFVRHKLKKIVFGHAVLFFYGHTFMQTFQIVQNV